MDTYSVDTDQGTFDNVQHQANRAQTIADDVSEVTPVTFDAAFAAVLSNETAHRLAWYVRNYRFYLLAVWVEVSTGALAGVGQITLFVHV